MPTLPTGKASRPRAQPGFTLIELLIVVSVMAILATGAALVAGGAFGGRDPVGRLAGRLELAVTRARDAALFQRAVLGLRPLADGWQVLRLQPGQGWQPEGAAVRQPGALLGWAGVPGPLVPGAGTPDPREVPPIRFAPDGGASPFSVSLALGGQRRECRLAAGAEGLECG